MQDTTSTGTTDSTSPVIIERIDGAQALFFSRKVGRDFGQPTGGWSTDRSVATRMPPGEADDLLEGVLAPMATSCKVVPA